MEASAVHECYVMPLGAAFMPLCGNGRIDLLTDYVAYFGTSERQQMKVAQKYMLDGSTSSDLMEVQWAQDEMCDDGNRLDGDGCAADCLSVDAFVSPCLLPVPPAVEDLVFWGKERALISLPDGIYQYNFLGVDRATNLVQLVPKAFRVNAMYYLSTDVLYLYTPNDGMEGPGAVYVVSLTSPTLQKLFWIPTSTVPTSELSYFVEDASASKLFLICKEPLRLSVWNAFSGEKLAQVEFSTPALIHHVLYAVNTSQFIMKTEALQVTWDMKGLAVVSLPQEPNFWKAALQWLVYGFGALVPTAPPAPVYVSPPLERLQPQPTNHHYQTQIALSFLEVVQSAFSPRWLLLPAVSHDPSPVRVQADHILRNASSLSVETLVCQDVLAVLSLLRRYPLSLDMLQSKMALANNATTTTTLYDILALNVASSASSLSCHHSDDWLPALRNFSLTLRRYLFPDRLLRKVLVHPTLQSVWILHASGALKEMGRLGVSMEMNETHCVPTTARLCMSVCQWSSACVSCSAATADEQSTLEWSVQCAGCDMTGRRRLLGSQSLPLITMTVSGCTSYVLASYFKLSYLTTTLLSSNASSYIRQVSTRSYEIQIPTQTPQQTMRDLQALMRADFPCDVVTQPRLVYTLAASAACRTHSFFYLASLWVFCIYITLPFW